MNALAVGAIAIIALLILQRPQRRTATGLSATGGAQPGVVRAPSAGGFAASIPGFGQVSQGPGGFTLLLDPRLFQQTTGPAASGTVLPDVPPSFPTGWMPSADVAGAEQSAASGLPIVTPSTGAVDPIAPPSIPIDSAPPDPTQLDASFIPSAVQQDPSVLDLGVSGDPTLTDPSAGLVF